MALTFGPGLTNFPGEGSAELQELQQLIREQRRLLTEEAGLQEVDVSDTLGTFLGQKGIGEGTFDARIEGLLRSGASAGDIAKEFDLPSSVVKQFVDERNRFIELTNHQARLQQQLQQAQALGNSSQIERIQQQLGAAQDQLAQSARRKFEMIVPATRFEKTPERLEQEARLKEFQKQQEEILGLQAERQIAGLRGELPVSEATQQAKQEQFEQFKEAQARIGNIIVGDTPENAAARGTGAQAALENFKQRVGLVEETERRGELTQGAAVFQSSLGQIPTLGAGFAGTIPQIASTLGLQALGPASSPFFQQQQLNLQQAAIEAQRAASKRSGRSALLGAGIGALGSIGGGLIGSFGGPFGAFTGTQAGGQFATQFVPGIGNVQNRFAGLP